MYSAGIAFTWLLTTSTICIAVPLRYLDVAGTETVTVSGIELSLDVRQVPQTANSTATPPPITSPGTTNATTPNIISGGATVSPTPSPNVTTPPSPATTPNTTRAPTTTTTTRTTIATITTATTTPQPTTRPAMRNCTLGDDILNVLLNRTTMEAGMFTLENSVGVVGTREEILNALMMNFRNHSRQEIEACLDLYRIPPEPPVATPDPSGDSLLAYQRPGFVGGRPVLPVPRPFSDNFNYGHGYTTYQNPFNIGQRVPLYTPHTFLRVNSLQDLFRTLAQDFLREFNLFWEHGTPAFWFDRNAAPRRP